MLKQNLLVALPLILSLMLLSSCGAFTESPSTTSENGITNDPSSGEQSSAEPQTITVEHALGETTVPVNPEKVVVFDFGVLDSLDKLGIDVVGIPKASVPSYLAKYEDAKYENLGSLVEPDFEKVNAVSPDLIIISSRQREAYEEFSKIAPTIYMGVDTTRYMESFAENARILGNIFDKEDEVEAALAEIQAQVDELKDKISASGKTALVVMANEGNISVYGPNSRFGLIHDTFGFEPADPNIEVSTHGQSVSFEYLVDKDPDYLFVIDRGMALGGQPSARTIVENELTANMKAVQNGNVVYLDAEIWYLSGGGLVSVARMVEEVAAAVK